MAWPADPLPIVHELFIDGAWVDITSDVRGAQGYGGTGITRGYSGEQSQFSAGSTQFTINNRDGKYTNRNPGSTYYRKLGRNTPYRCGVDTGVVSARFLDTSTASTGAYDGSCAYMADTAAIDITGDIDIAIDIEVNDWRGRRGHIFVTKYVITGDQRSWAFISLPTGYLQFIWSTDGTSAGRVFATCPVQVAPDGRVQYRVQLDVDNGAGGWTCSFYQGDGSVTGTYTLIGSTTGTGTTSIYSSSARLEVGDGSNGARRNGVFGSGTDADPFTGKFYAMLLRSGINGTGVAAFRPDRQNAGDTTWVDAEGNTWTMAGSAYLSSTDFRFHGEVPSLPNRWDSTGTDIYIPVRAADIVQRLTSGNNLKPLESAVKRNLKQFTWNGYWPMEQDFSSDTIAAYVGQPGTKTNADFSPSPSGFDGSAGSLVFNDDTGTATASCTPSSGTPSTTTFLFYFRFDSLPPSSTFVPIIEFFPTGGSASRITLYANSTNYKAIVIGPTGSTLVADDAGGFGGLGYSPVNWTAMRVKLSGSSGTITFEWAWYQVNGLTPVGLTDSYSGTMGRPGKWVSEGFTGKFGLELAHVAMGSEDFDFIAQSFIDSTNAFRGETWISRARRLGAEQLQPVYIEGPEQLWGSDSFLPRMGAQSLKTYVELLQECATASGGILYCPRDKFGLTIRSWEQMIGQGPGPQFDYSAGHLSGSLEPEPDDFLIENDVTLTTPDGSSYRFVKETGSLNVQDPGTDADAVGTYDVKDFAPLDTVDDLKDATQRRVAFGTWDEARYPKVQVNLERAPFTASASLTEAARRLDLGRPFSITNPPSWLPPGSINLMTTGYVETLGGARQELAFNARPRGPWSAGVWGSTTSATSSLWGAASTTLKTAVNSTATSLTFTTPDAAETWSTTASGYLVEIAGEQMTVSSVTGPTGSGPYEYAVTVVRSANGVALSLAAGETVTVVDQGEWA